MTQEQMTIFGDGLPEIDFSAGLMQLEMEIKQPPEFFWLIKIRSVDITQCCKRCFNGDSMPELYHATKSCLAPKNIKLEIAPEYRFKAYYLCGLSKGFVHELNTHIAFLFKRGETLSYESGQVRVRISNAECINFEGYCPNPKGTFSDWQRKCRNWIFANYLKDGKL